MNRGTLVVLLIAFAAGGGIGYVAGTGLTEPGGGPPADDRAESAPPRAPSRPATGAPDRPAGEGVSSLGDLLAKLPPPERETGTGAITGHVRLQDGTPIEGAVVHATPYRRFGSRPVRGGPPPDLDVEKRLREYAERLLHQESSRVVARSGPDGSYALTHLSDHQHSLQAWCEGYVLEPTYRQARPGDRVDYVAKPVVRVPLTVLMDDGTPPEPGAFVQSRMGDRMDGQWWSPEAGAVALEPGTWMVQAMGGENNQLKSEEVEVTVEMGTEPAPVTLRLASKPGLRGRVQFPAGATDSYCEVKAIRVPPGKEVDPKRLLREGQSSWAHARSGGSYAINNLSPGTYLVGLVVDHKEVVVSETVEIADRMVEKDLELPEPDPEDCVIVRVEGPDGKLVSDASFSTGYRAKRPYWSRNRGRATRLPDGRYRVVHHAVEEGERTPEGRYSLDVISPRFGSKRVEYDRATTRELTVRFEEPATLTVTVLGYAGSGQEGRIGLTLNPAEWPEGPYAHYFPGMPGRGELSSEGVQKFTPLAPGEYTLVLYITTGNQSRSAAQERVLLKSGPNRLSIGIPALYTVTVTAEGAGARTNLSLRRKGGAPGASFHRSAGFTDGRVVFEGVPAGEYTLTGYGELSGEMDITVPGQEVVRFEPRAINAFQVSITDPEGGFARAGLRDGDLLVGVDGKEFTDQAQMQALMTLAMKKESCTLSVVRGNSRIDVAIPLGETGYSGDKAGGRLALVAR